jgi:lipoprotein NlpD
MNNRAIGTIVVMAVIAAGCSTSTTQTAPIASTKPVQAAKKIDPQGAYIVQPGDTLYSVAWEFGIDYRDIIDNNKLRSPYTLHTGEHLKLVKPSHTSPAGLGNPTVNYNHLPANYASKNIPVTKNKTVAKATTTTPKWIWPTQGKISKSYSVNSAHPNKGINIVGKAGQPIVAAASGEVVYSGNGIPGYGNLIIIKHNALYLTAYAQNEKNLVKEGQKIKQGQKIAKMGTSKNKQAELHFEIRYAGKPVNPQKYLL